MVDGSIRLLRTPTARWPESMWSAQIDGTSLALASGSNRTNSFHGAVASSRRGSASQLKKALGPPISRHHAPCTVPGDTSHAAEPFGPGLGDVARSVASAEEAGRDGSVGAGLE